MGLASRDVRVREAQDGPAGELDGVGERPVGLERVLGAAAPATSRPRRSGVPQARRSQAACGRRGPAPAVSGCRGGGTGAESGPRAWTDSGCGRRGAVAAACSGGAAVRRGWRVRGTARGTAPRAPRARGPPPREAARGPRACGRARSPGCRCAPSRQPGRAGRGGPPPPPAARGAARSRVGRGPRDRRSTSRPPRCGGSSTAPSPHASTAAIHRRSRLEASWPTADPRDTPGTAARADATVRPRRDSGPAPRARRGSTTPWRGKGKPCDDGIRVSCSSMR